jgi:hypothetical protein
VRRRLAAAVGHRLSLCRVEDRGRERPDDMPMSTLILHPTHEALAADVAALRDELAALLAEVDELVEFVRPNLLALYQVRLGPAELDLLSARYGLARVKRAIELAQAALNTGRKPDPGRIEAALERESTNWADLLATAAKKLAGAQQHLKGLLPKEESEELRRLYLLLVKRLHPDLHPDLADGEKKLWHRVQEANRLNDLAGMRALLALVDAKGVPEETPALDVLAHEKDVLSKHVVAQRKKIAVIRSAPPFTMARELNDEVWVRARRGTLAAEAERLRRQAKELGAHLEILMADSHELEPLVH